MIDFESNMKLVYYVYNKRFKKYNWLKDDLLQNGFIGLWKACKNFNENAETSFSSFAYSCIKNEMNIILRKENEYNLIDEEFCFELTEDKSQNFDERLDFLIDIRNEANKHKNKKIFNLWANGYTQKEIGNIVGKSQSRVCRNIKDINKKLNEAFYEKN